MAPKIIRPLQDIEFPDGLNKARDDSARLLVAGQEQARQSNWQILCGAVQVSLASAGWSCIALENSNGVVVASSGGRADRWGVQTDHPPQPGTRVSVAVNWLTEEAVVIGCMANRRVDSRNQFDIPTYVGCWADASRDVLREIYNVAEDAGGTAVYENGALADVCSGDWMVRSSLGSYILLSCFSIELAVDDVTGLWINLLDQSLELSARQLTVAADGLKLHKSLTDKLSSLQLGGQLKFHGDPVPKDPEGDVDSWSQTDCTFAYGFETEPVEVFGYNLWGLDGVVAAHQEGDLVQTGSGRSVDFRAMTLCRYPDLAFVEYRPVDDEDPAEWHPAVSAEKPDRDKLIKRLAEWEKELDGCHFTQPLIAMAAVSAKWLDSPEHYVRFKKPSAPDGESNRLDALYKHESVQFGDDKLDPVFIGKQLDKLNALLSWFHPQPDGSMKFGNESGTSIRLDGTGIFMEATSFRGSFRKDASLLARDINLRANRDVSLMSTEFTRVCSKRNIAMVGGLSGRGGVLIEGRSTVQKFELPDDAQKSNYAGVAIRTTSSPLILQGGDVLIHAGAVSSGQLVVRSDGGPISLTTPYRVITHSSGRLDTFGSDPFNPVKTHYYGQNSIVLDGNLMAGSALFTKSVRAAADIQSISGRMADSQGGKILKVQPQGITRFTEDLQTRQQSVNAALENWIENAGKLQTRLQSEGGPLNRNVINDLSVGFVSTLKAEEHYGTKSLQPTTTAVFQAGWGVPLEPMVDFEVTYKPNAGTTGGPTYGWPGSTQEVNFTLPVVESLSNRLDLLFSSEVQPVRWRQAGFAEVFATFKG